MNISLTNSTANEEEPLIIYMTSDSILSFYIINVLLGLPLNIYVFVLLIKAGRPDGSVIFSLSQSLSEILFSSQMPFFILCYLNVRLLCFLKPAAFFIGAFMSSRFLFQSCVCLERYLAVVHPITFRKYKSKMYRVMLSAVIWIYSIICGIVSSDNLLNMPYTAIGFLYIIIMSVHLFFCFSILRALRKPGPGERKGCGVNAAKKKAFELVSFNLLIFLIQTIPISVAVGVKNVMSVKAFSLAFTMTMNFNIAAGIMQPILTLHQMGKLTVENGV